MLRRFLAVALCAALVSACAPPGDTSWTIETSADQDRALVVRVASEGTVSSWLLSRGNGRTLFHADRPHAGEVLLMDPSTCEILDRMPLPSQTGVLMVSETADLLGYDLSFAPDSPATRTTVDVPDFEGCAT